VTVPSWIAFPSRAFTCATAPSKTFLAGPALPATCSASFFSWAIRLATSCFSFSTVIAPFGARDAVFRLLCFDAVAGVFAGFAAFDPSAWALIGRATRDNTNTTVDRGRIMASLERNPPGDAPGGAGDCNPNPTPMSACVPTYRTQFR
jgi:hypothetical protein